MREWEAGSQMATCLNYKHKIRRKTSLEFSVDQSNEFLNYKKHKLKQVTVSYYKRKNRNQFEFPVDREPKLAAWVSKLSHDISLGEPL